jgi:RNA polymerase sigma-70 factor (ECF subfamily)
MTEKAPAPASSSAVPDEEILERVLAGDTALYEILVRRYNTRLYRTVRAVLRSDRDVEDVMQDAYVLAFRNLGRFEGRSRFSTWLTRIAVNEALARRQESKRTEEWDAMDESQQGAIAASREAADPETEAASAEWKRLLERSIVSLPESYRLVVMLRDVEGMSTSETAECLSITEDNVKVRLHRAHGLLRKGIYAKARVSAADAFPFPAVRCDRVVASVFARIGRR